MAAYRFLSIVCGISVCGAAALAAQSAAAQDLSLDTIVVETEDNATGGTLGPAIAEDSSTATKTGTAIIDTPRSVSVETQQQIADKGMQRLEDALAYTAGVRSGSFGFDPRGNWSTVRGFEPATLLDGLPYDSLGYYNNVLPEMAGLERVEILKGPSSMLYGNGTVGGIVNAITKRPLPYTFRRATVEYGSFNRKQATLDMTGPLDEQGKWLGRIVALVRDAETQVDYSRNDALMIAPSLTWRPTVDTSVTLLAHYQKNKATPDVGFLSQFGTLEPSPDGRFLPSETFVGEPGFDRLDAEQAALTLDLDHRFNAVWSVHATGRYSQSDARYDHAWWIYDDYPTRYKPDGRIERTFFTRLGETEFLLGDVHALAEFATGPARHKLMFGVAHSDITHDDDDGYGDGSDPSYWIDPFDPVYTGAPPVSVVDTPAINFRQTGLYAQDEIEIDRWRVMAGLRWDDVRTVNPGASVDRSDSEVSGMLGVLYRFDNGIAPYASYTESFRQENLGTDAAGNAFDPTRGEQFEAGVKYQPPGTSSLFTLAYFDITKSNILQTDPDNPTFSVQTGEASARGIELEALVALGDFVIEGNYAYVDAADENGAPLDTVAEHTASAWVTYRPQGAWEGFKAGAGVRYVGSSYGDVGTVKTPGQALGDLMIGYETDKWDATLNVRNVTDEEYVSHTGFATGYYGERRTIVLRLGSNF